MPAFMSAKQAAVVAGVSEKTVRRWVASGRLKADKNGRSFRIPAEAIAAIGGHTDGSSPDSPVSTVVLSGDVRSPTPDTGQDGLIALVTALTARTEWLEQERFELAGRLGYFQAQLEQAQTTIKALSPPDAPNGAESSQEPAAPVETTTASPRPWWRFW